MIDIKEEVASFLRAIEAEYKFDLLFAIQRKGMAHLKMIPVFREQVGRRLFFLDAIRFIQDRDLEHKKVLVYDDACQTGSHLSMARDIFNGTNCSVKTAVLAAHRQCTIEPNFRRFSLPHYTIKQLLSVTVDEQIGQHIYDDHLVLTISTNGGDYHRLLSSLESLGRLTQIFRFFVDDIKAVSLENFSFLDIVQEFKGLIEREGVEKIRLFFQNNGDVNIVPRLYPAILLDRTELDYLGRKTSHICKSFPPLIRQVENERYPYVYCKCMIWTINAVALSAFRKLFLEHLKDCGYKIVGERINEPDIKAAVYHGDDVVSAIKRAIGLEG